MSLLEVIWAEKMELLLECWEDLVEVATEGDFALVLVALAVIILVGTGLSRNHLKRIAFGVSLAALGGVLYFGIERGEAGEVLFNGTLL